MPILRRTLIGLRWQLIGYGLGLFAWATVVVLLYPSIRDIYADVELPEAYRALFGDAAVNLGDFRNFVNVELYQWIPLIMSIYVVVAATGTLAGDEGRGVMEILLTQPLSRRRVFLEKAGALLAGAVVIAAVAALGVMVTVPFVDTGDDVSLARLVVGVFATLPFVVLIGSFALLLSAIAPSRGTAAAITAAVVVVSWLGASLSGLSSQTEWLRYLSGYYYAGIQTIPSEGPVPWHLALVLGLSAAQIGLAVAAFERREIEVATWQLHLRRPRGAESTTAGVAQSRDATVEG